MKSFRIDKKCIGCNACVKVAPENMQMKGKKAFMLEQPKNAKEEKQCDIALGICPVQAIELLSAKEVIIADSKVRDTLEKYPELKEVMWAISPKFKTMQNPVMWNTVARFASFRDAAKMSGISVCEILHILNKKIGTEDELFKNAPECIQHNFAPLSEQYKSVPISWLEEGESFDIADREDRKTPSVIDHVLGLRDGANMLVFSEYIVNPLIQVIEENGCIYNIEEVHPKRFKLSIFKKNKEKSKGWKERLDDFERLDVRKMKEDPFDVILKKAYDTKQDDGFVIVQKFKPDPLINMLSEMGFEHLAIEKEGDSIFQEVWTYFYKTPKIEEPGEIEKSDKPALTIQSATPVGYPVIMRLLQSKRLTDAVSIKELKVWRETEKHLAWVVDGRADVTFSAVITASKLKQNDIIMPAVFVWDNFFVITRGYEAQSFEDIKGKTIHTPLFEDAPPTKITKYLIESLNMDISDFTFTYGQPFGRPEEILESLIKGEADTAILREPEASFAINALKKRGEKHSVLSFGDVWNEVNEGFGLFPNAGVMFKGELARKHPEVVKLFLEELEEAIVWVTTNKKAAAALSFDMMRQQPDDVELFLDRVTFHYMAGKELTDKIGDYYKLLIDSGIVQTEWDDALKKMFSEV